KEKNKMLPFNIQPIHLIVIVVIALLIFGPRRLPEIGRSIGKAITEFRKGAREMTESFKEEMNAASEAPKTTIAPPAVSQPPVSTAPQATTFPSDQPAPADKKFCIHCGTANPISAVYCNSCGNKVSE
ncbi:MAG TPA: twin-arginine translocase TatA/TatE family subunit, partial [Anaerolineaceae bacterium]|nr:twin-arginine translocase TatA/TatE family subunit [Anaerolineaceae bacterium]